MDETIVTSMDQIQDNGDKKPFLTFIKGSRLGQLFEITPQETIVGRSSDCNLWIEDSTISRKHFKIILNKGCVEIEDLGSTNGTYINGDRIQTAILSDGDKIQISQDSIFELNFLDKTRVLSEQKRYEMGVMDPVTGVHNKRYFLDRIREEFAFAIRKKSQLAMIIFDIDHFKIINDTYGHLAGDLVLQRIGNVISKMIREGDVFARYGGEEFVIVMREANIKNAFDLAERIREAVAALEIDYEKQPVQVQISAGVSELNQTHTEYAHLIADADQKLYKAKKGGRNRVCAT